VFRRPVCGDVGDWKALEESLRGNGFGGGPNASNGLSPRFR